MGCDAVGYDSDRATRSGTIGVVPHVANPFPACIVRVDQRERRTSVTNNLPRLLITMGDVAGIGPEIIARAWPGLLKVCEPIVVGDSRWLDWALRLTGSVGQVVVVGDP